MQLIDLLKEELPKTKRQTYLKIINPLVDYLMKNKEQHAVISNHLATASAALFLWTELTGEKSESYKEVLDLIYKNQSNEGWYKEYEGPDPGYQTLCTHYLSVIYNKTQDQKLKNSLKKSLAFLFYFIHPDGTIGGLYGSRNTEVYYPGGITSLTSISDQALHLALALNKGIEIGNAILPQDIDADNYIPLLNSYALAALNIDKLKIKNDNLTPFYLKGETKNFKESGIELFSNQSYFSILNYKKGGTLKVFDLVNKVCEYDSGGVFYFHKKETLTTQRFDEQIVKGTSNSFLAHLYFYKEQYPSLFQTIIIRLLAMSMFKFVFLVEYFKKLVVRFLMTNKSKSKINVKVRVKYLDKHIQVKLKFSDEVDQRKLIYDKKLKAIHMASSGYILKSNVEKINSSLVKTIIE